MSQHEVGPVTGEGEGGVARTHTHRGTQLFSVCVFGR